MPAPICAHNPSTVSWSELTHLGARSAIHCNARFSIRAVSAWFTRRALSNATSLFAARIGAPIVASYLLISSRAAATGSLLQRIPRRTQRKLQRFPRHAVHKRPNRPPQPLRNGPAQRNRLDLDIQPAVPLFVAPIVVQPPKIAVVFICAHGTFLRRTRRVNLSDFHAP